MEAPGWIKEHLGHIVGGTSAGAGGAAVLYVAFRDGINKLIEDWRDERRARRAERLAAVGHDDRAMTELLTLLKGMISAQAAQERETVALLGQMATSHERSLDVQRTTSNQISDMDKRLGRIEGAVNAGRFQQ